MNFLRKYFNTPTIEQAIVIEDGRKAIVKLAEKISNDHYNLQSKAQTQHNSKCPICKGSEIVNKIARVEGSGKVSGHFSLGYGSVYGSSTTDTNEVNHCNKCGNQWKKYERTYKSSTDIINDWLYDLATVFEGRYTFGDKTVVLLKDIPAESIWEERKRLDYKCGYTIKENLSLSALRKHFKSVYV